MQVDVSKNQGFAFSYTTSSGKSLSFAMFDKAEASISKDESSSSLSLKREYGYSFSYEGSKLTDEDLAEIKNAMKEVAPQIDEFLQNSKVSQMNPKEIISSAMSIANLLPSSSDENKMNATLDSLADKISELLNKNKSPILAENENMLKASKDLFDEVMQIMRDKIKQAKESEEKDLNSLNLYA
ncbi:ATP-binding protein [uncultured Campylobacter sp.]|uniref:ATP-binding protein n=1 Tax=uncultured Campylobacter sp. TaxID=218934 RepID=UPI00261D3112|nr:ATP-binding protein [uncultured Campylobacter sp.]